MIDVKSLKSTSLIKAFKSTTVLANAGEINDKMYILVKGSAIIYENYRAPKQRIAGELNPGEFFGEMALFLNKPSLATIVSLGAIKALEITRNNVYQFFQNDPEAAYLITQYICQNFDNLSNSYTSLYAQTLGAPQPEFHVKPIVPAPVQAPPSIQASAPVPAHFPQVQSTPTAPIPQPAQPKVEPKPEQKPKAEPQKKTQTNNAATEASSVKTKKTTVSKLFPNGHRKEYKLPPLEANKDLLFNENLICPICNNKFDFPQARTALLKSPSTDYDLRKTYDGINTTHYLAATCPTCLFSGVAANFANASKIKKDKVLKITNPYKEDLELTFKEMNADTIFARLYLALEFTELCFDNSEILNARIWLNISWLYRDCGDMTMENYAIEQALKAYDKVYQNVSLAPKVEQSICLILGELNHKLGNDKEAQEFFFTAKQNNGNDLDVKNLAEARLAELKGEKPPE